MEIAFPLLSLFVELLFKEVLSRKSPNKKAPRFKSSIVLRGGRFNRDLRFRFLDQFHGGGIQGTLNCVLRNFNGVGDEKS